MVVRDGYEHARRERSLLGAKRKIGGAIPGGNMKITGLMVAVVGAFALAACSSTSKQSGPSNGAGAPTAPSQQESAPGNVEVERVRVFVKDGRVQAFLQGKIGDGCTKLQPMSQ